MSIRVPLEFSLKEAHATLVSLRASYRRWSEKHPGGHVEMSAAIACVSCAIHRATWRPMPDLWFGVERGDGRA